MPSRRCLIAFVAFACCTSGAMVGEYGDVDGDGRIDRLVANENCGTQGCTFEVRIGVPPRQTTPFRTVATSCRILDTRSAGYSDIECVQRHRVEARGTSWIRVTNRYRWNGAAYVSPLDHLGDGVRPATPAPCPTVRITEPVDVLMLPARGVRVSVPRSGGARGWKTGPATTPIAGTLAAGTRVSAIEQVTSQRTGAWLLVKIGEHSEGWVEARYTDCAEGTGE